MMLFNQPTKLSDPNVLNATILIFIEQFIIWIDYPKRLLLEIVSSNKGLLKLFHVFCWLWQDVPGTAAISTELIQLSLWGPLQRIAKE